MIVSWASIHGAVTISWIQILQGSPLKILGYALNFFNIVIFSYFFFFNLLIAAKCFSFLDII